jgi:hypothetical protein
MKEPTSNSPVPFAIWRKLWLIRQRKLFVQVAVAAVAAVAVLLAAMGLAMLIDWLATLYDSRWRYVLTATAVLAAVITGVGWLVVAWRRLLGVERIAGDVDRHIPQLAERWTTMTRLDTKDAANPQVVHPAMLRRVASEAEGWEPHVEPEQVVSLSTLMRAMLCLTAITVVLGTAVVFNSYQTLVLLQRFWLPGSSISATRLVNVPGDVVVGRGEPLALAAAVEGTPVENAILFVRNENDPLRTITLVARGEPAATGIEFSHRVRSVESPFEYRFRAGDGQTDWFSVGVADRPEIEALELTVTPPAYTRQPAKTFDKLPPRLAALEQSDLELKLRSTIPVKSVQLELGKEKRVSLAADAEGWYRWKIALTEGFTLAPILTEPHGLTNQRIPKCEFTVYKDKPPAVKVVTPDDRLAVRPDDTVQIAFTATDDVGIGMAELLVYDEAATVAGQEPVPIATIPIPLGDQAGARSVQETVDLDLSKFTVEDGSELSYEIRVREDRGGAAVGGQVASSQQPQSQSGEADATTQAMNRPQEQIAANNGAAAQSTAAVAANDQSENSAATTSSTDSQPQEVPSSASGPRDRENLTAQSADGSQGAADPSAGTANAERMAANEAAQTERAASNTAAGDAQSQSTESDKIAANTPAAGSNPERESAAQSNNDRRPDAETQANNDNSSQARDAQSAGKPQPDAGKLASDSPSASTTSSGTQLKPGDEDKTARTASTGRQSLSADRAPQEPQPQSPSSSTANSNQSPQRAKQQAGAQQSSSSNQASTSESQPSSPSDPPPGDSMTRRSLDIAQSSSSNRMRLSVDQWAGSFESQQRAKLEMAIAPELDALDKSLAKAQQTARGVLDELEANRQWRATHDRDVANAERSADESQRIVKRLQDRSKDTPYAFIGLQVTDISLAHIGPARTNFWKALESQGDDRIASVRDGWQHIGRARELVAELRGQYERARREFQLAESVERVKKMYQVYLENSQALLETQDSDPTRYGRKMVEFDLDDDYLKRLQEVLEMRRDLRAELARILAEDPRLLRRFMDSLRYRSNNLREELAKLVNDQADLNREVRAWTLVEDADRPRIEKILLLRQVQEAAKMATAAGELQTRYQTWLPLDRESKDAELAAATKTIQAMAAAASELNASAQQFVADAQRVTATPSAGDAASETPGTPASTEASEAPAASVSQQPLDDMLADAQALYEQLSKSEVALRQLAVREDGAETATFAANRLVDTRRLIADTSAWVRQTRAHKAGNYTGAAEVDQYRLAMKTEELAGKLGSIEQTLAGVMQRSDGSLPQPIAEKAREFISTLDKEVSPNQLAAVYALHSNQMPRATQRQKAAGDALTKAETTYDELMRLAIEELDKLPVQDPVADLLDDPTLDELLAQLEQELPLEELLGIPQRPSNLRIVGDWMRPGGDNALSTGGASMAMNQLRQNEQQARQRLNRAYQRAIARALKESVPKTKVEIPQPAKLADWNQLVSKLGDDLQQGRDKAPPEQYRRAIEQYFAQISRVVAEHEDQAE